MATSNTAQSAAQFTSEAGVHTRLLPQFISDKHYTQLGSQHKWSLLAVKSTFINVWTLEGNGTHRNKCYFASLRHSSVLIWALPRQNLNNHLIECRRNSMLSVEMKWWNGENVNVCCFWPLTVVPEVTSTVARLVVLLVRPLNNSVIKYVREASLRLLPPILVLEPPLIGGVKQVSSAYCVDNIECSFALCCLKLAYQYQWPTDSWWACQYESWWHFVFGGDAGYKKVWSPTSL